jgi:GntR family transcriptional repressor for pyruvate dehydrogenase complex
LDDFLIVRPKRMHDAIVEQVLNLIKAGKLRPNDPLPSERDLARSLGVSRPTVRTALSVLETMGIVELHHGKSTVLSKPRVDVLAGPMAVLFASHSAAVGHLMDFRLILEPGVAYCAALRAGPDDIHSLEEILERQSGRNRQGLVSVEEDAEFHCALANATRNRLLIQVFQVLNGLMKEVRADWLEDVGRGTASVGGHEAILRAVRSKASVQAFEAMRAHIEGIKDLINQRIACTEG